MSDTQGDKIWANSGDSHYMEPPDLYEKLPEHLRDKMPRTVRDEAANRCIMLPVAESLSSARSFDSTSTPTSHTTSASTRQS